MRGKLNPLKTLVAIIINPSLKSLFYTQVGLKIHKDLHQKKQTKSKLTTASIP